MDLAAGWPSRDLHKITPVNTPAGGVVGRVGVGVEAHEPQQLTEESMASGGEIVHFKAVAPRMPIMLQWMVQHL